MLIRPIGCTTLTATIDIAALKTVANDALLRVAGPPRKLFGDAHVVVGGVLLVGIVWAFTYLCLAPAERAAPATLFACGMSGVVVLTAVLLLMETHRGRSREVFLSREIDTLRASLVETERLQHEAEARLRRSQSARGFAEEVSEQKTRFVAIVSHELRTPLSAVINSLTLLDRSGLMPAQQRFANTARQAGDALLGLVNDILELSKMEAGHLAMRPTSFDIHPVLEGVQDMFRIDAEGRGVRIVLDVGEAVPARIRTDCGRLRQVLMNLVSNAAKFSLPGDVTIHAAVAAASDHEQFLLLAVRDQGPLIAEAEAARLFKPFSRLDSAYDAGTPGTGLGLAICQRLVRLMGGDIGVRAAPRGLAPAAAGNEFWLTLPLVLLAAPAAAGPDDHLVGMVHRPPALRRAVVLVVEDVAANQMLAATMLRQEGHRVDAARSGHEALMMIATQPYDIVLMDLVMPGMSGQEAARQIRAMGGPAARMAIVALTGNVALEDKESCIDAGMDDLVAKPMSLRQMHEALARILARRPHADPVRNTLAGDPSVVDLQRFADLRRGMSAATLASIVEQCLSDMRERLPDLHDALSCGRLDAIEETAHALAGLAASYGLTSIERKMKRVMSAARRADPVSATVAADDLAGELARASAAIRLLVREHAV